MSSGSESDDEFVPGEPEQVSEEDSANEETELQYEKEVQDKAQKRKHKQNIIQKKRKNTSQPSGHHNKELKEDKTDEQNPAEQKKRDDALWAKFLEGTDNKPKTKAELKQMPKESEMTKLESEITKSNTDTDSSASENGNPDNNTVDNPKVAIDDIKAKESRIFEFAGETVIVEGSVIKKTLPTTSVDSEIKLLKPPVKRGGGLSNLVGQLNRKNKLTTLEKSKLDWETFKQNEGIDEELKTLNRGKDGYLERQDFLQRTDVRQYELERDVRLSRRSNR